MKLLKKLSIFLFVLLLASCNVNPTSGVTSGSSDSVSSSLNNNSVTSVEISSSSSLNQFIGLTSRVVFNATLNQGASNTTSIEWFVDNEKSLTQSGLSFEFFPNAVKSYSIQAKVGAVVSNTLTINVGLPKFNLVSVEASTNNQINIKADSGITFSIAGLTIASSSVYNFANQIYTLNLLTPMIQGNTYNITASKSGFESTIFPFLYETRKLTVASIFYKGLKVSPSANGTYDIQKPFTGAPSQNYTISLQHTNLEGTNVPISIVTNVPSGATAISPYQAAITVQKGINITRDYSLSSASEPGIYSHNISISNVVLVVRIVVSNPTPSLALTTPVVYDLAATSGGGTPLASPFALDGDGDYLKDVVTPNSLGQYIVTRPYNGSAYELTFVLMADNFPTPLGFPAGSNPYNIIAGLNGPSGGVMYYGSTVNTLATTYPFRESTGNNYRISQYIDNKTNLGTYTYSFTATGFNLNITRTVTVVIREFTPEIEPIITYNNVELKANSDGSYNIYKPLGSNTLSASIGVKIKNYESPLASAFIGGSGVTTLYRDNNSSPLRYLLDARVSYSGPLSTVATLNTKLGLELGLSNTTKPIFSQTSPEVQYIGYLGAGSERLIDLVALRDATTYASTSIFAPMATITASTFPGVHTYTVQFGALSKAIIFRVLEPTPLIIIRDNVVQYGASQGVESENNVEYKESEDKYYVDGKNGFIKVNVYPFGMPTGGYTYTFTKRTPSGTFQSTTNTVNLTLRTDVVSSSGPPIVYSERYDGTLKFPNSGPGSEMIVAEQLLEEGEYIYTFNINNQIREIKVVVLAAPQLKVESVSLNDELLPYFNQTYYVSHATSTRYVEFNLVPVNVETTYKYILNATGDLPIGETLLSELEELVIIDGKMTVGVTLPARTSATASETHTYIIALYKGSVRIGSITRVVILSQPEIKSVYFSGNGGTAIVPISQFVGTTTSAPTPPTRTGYTFDSWHTSSSLSVGSLVSFPYTIPSGDIILFAKWTPVTYTITYTLNGGNNFANAPANYTIETPTITLGTPTKSSSVFQGWFTTSDFQEGTLITSLPLGTTGNKTLYAKFNP